jgi:hypothetical protein
MSEFHFQQVRSMILASLPPEEADALRAKWAAESKLSKSEEKPMSQSGPVGVANFLSELVAEQVELNESAARKAKADADESERTRVKALNTELKRHFGKLLDKGIGKLEGGEFRFSHSGTAYRVSMSEGAFLLTPDLKPNTVNFGWKTLKFGADGDAVTSLAKVLAKAGQ